MARLFDAYIFVDWSAATKPSTGANSIWIGVMAKDARLKFQYRGVNIDTRLKAREFIKDMIEKLTKRGDKVLLGFDFSLGYPKGTAKALGLDVSDSPPWQAIHKHFALKIRDKADNKSGQRFAIAAGMNYAISKGPYPFWGAPKRDQVSTLSATKPDFKETTTLSEYRLTETAMKKAKLGKPKSSWQLYGAGSVGSQSLMGIPHVHELQQTLHNCLIWPFQTGLRSLDDEALENVSTLMVEIYPSQLNVTPEEGEVIDAAQMRTIAHHYCDLDGRGKLAELFAGNYAPSDTQLEQIVGEEGWILPK